MLIRLIASFVLSFYRYPLLVFFLVLLCFIIWGAFLCYGLTYESSINTKIQERKMTTTTKKQQKQQRKQSSLKETNMLHANL